MSIVNQTPSARLAGYALKQVYFGLEEFNPFNVMYAPHITTMLIVRYGYGQPLRRPCWTLGPLSGIYSRNLTNTIHNVYNFQLERNPSPQAAVNYPYCYYQIKGIQQGDCVSQNS